MTKPFGRLSALCLAAAALAPAAALAAPQAPAKAAAAAKVAEGETVYDSAGVEVGTVAKIAGDKVAVKIGDSGLVVPSAAFVAGANGPELQAPKAKILAVLAEAKMDAAAVGAAIKPGAEVRSVDGAAVLGTVKSVTPQGAVMTAGADTITMPRAAFFLSDKGLAVKVTQKAFADGVKAAKAAKARQAGG